MSPSQSPSCASNPRTYSYGGLYGSRFLNINSFHPSSRVNGEDSTTSKRVEDVTKYKLPTYQAAAVVVRFAPLEGPCLDSNDPSSPFSLQSFPE